MEGILKITFSSLHEEQESDKPLKFRPLLETEADKEATATLKAELEMELQNLKQCTYKPYECTQLTLEGYNYCLRHVLQDKNALYKQCAYIYNNNGKRCHLPAPKDKKDNVGYCNEHALKTHLSNSKRGTRCQPPKTAEVMVHSLSHYIRKPRTRTLSSSTQYSDEGHNTPDENNDGVITKCLDPFVDVDANSILASGSDILDLCSESESDVEAATYGSVWHDAHADSSDNESIDSEQEDPLKHANIYSAEEVTSITKEKLIRLQSLYIDQFRYLTHMLRERRRRYIYSLKREKETYCSIYNQIHDNPKEQRLYKKLKAYNSYHRKHGIEAVCKKRLHERRIKATEGANFKPPSYSKCIYTEGGVKCGERALPITKHCRKHILEDPNQILFQACGKMGGDIECTTPVEAIFDDATCKLHIDIPLVRSYAQIRKDSESDYDDLEAHNAARSLDVIKRLTIKSESDNIGADSIKTENIKEENMNIDDQNLTVSNFIASCADVMSVTNKSHIDSCSTDITQNTLLNEDVCKGFPAPDSLLSPDESLESQADSFIKELKMNIDSLVASEISKMECSIDTPELSSIENSVVNSNLSQLKDTFSVPSSDLSQVSTANTEVPEIFNMNMELDMEAEHELKPTTSSDELISPLPQKIDEPFTDSKSQKNSQISLSDNSESFDSKTIENIE